MLPGLGTMRWVGWQVARSLSGRQATPPAAAGVVTTMLQHGTLVLCMLPLAATSVLTSGPLPATLASACLQAAAIGNMGQAAAAMHMLGAGAGAGTATRRPSYSKASKGGEWGQAAGRSWRLVGSPLASVPPTQVFGMLTCWCMLYPPGCPQGRWCAKWRGAAQRWTT